MAIQDRAVEIQQPSTTQREPRVTLDAAKSRIGATEKGGPVFVYKALSDKRLAEAEKKRPKKPKKPNPKT